MEGTLQAHNLKKIAEAKGYSFFVYPENWNDIKELLLVVSVGG